MKSITVQFFVTFGIIFLILMAIGVYVFVTDPYGLKPLLRGGSAPLQSDSMPVANTEQESADTDTNATAETEAAGGFTLSSAQVEALVGLGIDPAAVPTSISAEQEACFVAALGEASVAEIKAGAVPSALEFLKAKSCI